jgi:phage terminase large subunit-like protein
VVVPEGIVATGYPAVEAKCRDMGIVHDDWQRGLGRLILGKRADGKYAATVGGVVLSIPRQVGKTFTIGSIVFALCVLFPRLTVLWTAHHTRTSDETFGAMLALSNRKKVAPHIAARRRANGQQEIRFRNGSRIMFGAREQGFGRGFAEVDIEVFDEAQILSERALEDMVPATNQARHPSGALLFYMGTPPRPVDPGEVFRAKRDRALSGAAKDTVYVEMAADPDAAPDDRRQWAKANASYPLRTPPEAMQRMRENVGSDESFLREGMGVWPEVSTAERVVDPARWAGSGAGSGELVGVPAVALDVPLDRSRAWIGVGVARADDRVQVELLDSEPGVTWVVPRLAALCREHSTRVTLDGSGPAAALVPDLEDAGVPVELLSRADVVNACGAFIDAVNEGSLAHLHDPVLDAAVSAARLRPGESVIWTRKGGVDISPLYAVTLARWAAANAPAYDLLSSVY